MQIYKYHAKLPKILKISGKIFSQTLLSKTTPTPLEKTDFTRENSCKKLILKKSNFLEKIHTANCPPPFGLLTGRVAGRGDTESPIGGGYGGLTNCQSLSSVILSAYLGRASVNSSELYVLATSSKRKRQSTNIHHSHLSEPSSIISIAPTDGTHLTFFTLLNSLGFTSAVTKYVPSSWQGSSIPSKP